MLTCTSVLEALLRQMSSNGKINSHTLSHLRDEMCLFCGNTGMGCIQTCCTCCMHVIFKASYYYMVTGVLMYNVQVNNHTFILVASFLGVVLLLLYTCM